jgi:hypothetical protein
MNKLLLKVKLLVPSDTKFSIEIFTLAGFAQAFLGWLKTLSVKTLPKCANDIKMDHLKTHQKEHFSSYNRKCKCILCTAKTD